MPVLIGLRLLQGIGAGAIQPIALTVVGDLYTAKERGRVQGWLASVWAISAVAGPLAGGVIIAHLSWAWVFWINIPLGLLATFGFVRFLHEGPPGARKPLDTAGAILFALAVAALMVALTEAGTAGWPLVAGAAGVAIGAAILFAVQERRALDPMVAFELWSRRVVAATNGATLLAGMALIGITSFLPVYVQGVLGRTPLVAGFALTMTMLGWPIGATISARLYRIVGVKAVLLGGGLFIPLGAVFLFLLGPSSSPVQAGIGSLVMGLGFGLFMTPAIVLIQESVPWSARGSATASNVFARNLGSTLGAAVFGAVLNVGLSRFRGPDGTPSVTSDQLRGLLDGTAPSEAIRSILHDSLHLTFAAVLACSAAVILLAALVPPTTLGRDGHVPDPEPSSR